jgi:ribulose-phosphate 3-epimerase
VDGGVDRATIGRVVAAGADVLVAGSALFSSGAPAEEIAALRRLAAEPAR